VRRGPRLPLAPGSRCETEDPTAGRPHRIVSGGQTGVDRAALDVALELGIDCGGWCPKGRRAEDGPIPERYPVRELGSERYEDRTERNVLDSDGTLILTCGELAGGTALTHEIALRRGRPALVVNLDDEPTPEPVREWIASHGIATLNVAGPRESGRPGIHFAARAFLERLLAQEE
jgi:hypothetical protein